MVVFETKSLLFSLLSRLHVANAGLPKPFPKSHVWTRMCILPMQGNCHIFGTLLRSLSPGVKSLHGNLGFHLENSFLQLPGLRRKACMCKCLWAQKPEWKPKGPQVYCPSSVLSEFQQVVFKLDLAKLLFFPMSLWALWAQQGNVHLPFFLLLNGMSIIYPAVL